VIENSFRRSYKHPRPRNVGKFPIRRNNWKTLAIKHTLRVDVPNSFFYLSKCKRSPVLPELPPSQENFPDPMYYSREDRRPVLIYTLNSIKFSRDSKSFSLIDIITTGFAWRKNSFFINLRYFL